MLPSLFFQRKMPLMEGFPLGGQPGVLCFSCVYLQGGLAVHHAFQIVVRRREQDLLDFGQRLLSLVLEVNIGLFIRQGSRRSARISGTEPLLIRSFHIALLYCVETA